VDPGRRRSADNLLEQPPPHRHSMISTSRAKEFDRNFEEQQRIIDQHNRTQSPPQSPTAQVSFQNETPTTSASARIYNPQADHYISKPMPVMHNPQFDPQTSHRMPPQSSN
jgi:hypothetical protein